VGTAVKKTAVKKKKKTIPNHIILFLYNIIFSPFLNNELNSHGFFRFSIFHLHLLPKDEQSKSRTGLGEPALNKKTPIHDEGRIIISHKGGTPHMSPAVRRSNREIPNVAVGYAVRKESLAISTLSAKSMSVGGKAPKPTGSVRGIGKPVASRKDAGGNGFNPQIGSKKVRPPPAVTGVLKKSQGYSWAGFQASAGWEGKMVAVLKLVIRGVATPVTASIGDNAGDHRGHNRL
jgi:hypothetical protein